MDERTECEFQKKFSSNIVECTLSSLKFSDHPSPHFFCKTCKRYWENPNPSPDDKSTWPTALKIEVEIQRDIEYRILNPEATEVPDGEFSYLFNQESSEEPLPSFTQMVKNFGSSMKLWAKAGFATVSKAVFNERLGICKKCKHWKKNRCSICGCFGVKLHLVTAKCPDKPPRWNEEPKS